MARGHATGPRHAPIPAPSPRCDDCGRTAPGFYRWARRSLCGTCLSVAWIRWLGTFDAPEAGQKWRAWADDNLARIRAALAG